MYSMDDCCLVRKTSVFPEHGIVETPINGRAYSYGSSSIMGDALNKVLREKIVDLDKFIEELHKYDIYFETYRRTIHFTINGVVANSMYGEFNYPFAIIEPLKHHIDDESLKGLRVEDTYFIDNMNLSNDSIILIPEDRAFDLENEYDFSGLHIITYSGSIDDAIKDTLEELGYDYFVVNDHGYRDGLSSNTKDSEMYEFITSYAKDHNISQSKHFYSEINYEDQQKRFIEGEKVDLMHLQYIIDSGLVSDELINKINELLPSRTYYKKDFNDLMVELINEVGLDNLLFLTNEFNKMMVNDRLISKTKSK